MHTTSLNLARSFWLRCFLITTLFVGGRVSAQDLPPDFVHDKANIFRDHEEQLQNVVASLETLNSQYGYKIYLVTCYSVLSGTLQERADEMYQQWLGDESKGLMIIFQLDPVVEGQILAISYHKDAHIESARAAGIISAREWQGIYAKMLRSLKKNQSDNADGIEKMIAIMRRELLVSKTAVPLQIEQDQSTKIPWALVGIALFLVVVLMILCSFLLRGRRYHFPEVDFEERLGAPHGGGHVTETRFAPFSLRR